MKNRRRTSNGRLLHGVHRNIYVNELDPKSGRPPHYRDYRDLCVGTGRVFNDLHIPVELKQESRGTWEVLTRSTPFRILPFDGSWRSETKTSKRAMNRRRCPHEGWESGSAATRFSAKVRPGREVLVPGWKESLRKLCVRRHLSKVDELKRDPVVASATTSNRRYSAVILCC